MSRRLVSALTAGAALVLLTACSAGAATLGTPQEIQLEHEDSKTDAKVAVTVTSVEQATIDVLADFQLDAEDLERTPYLVDYELTLLEGQIGADYSPFSVSFIAGSRPTLTAKDAAGNDATAMHLIGGLDACPSAGDGAYSALAVGEAAGGCRVFLADSDEGLQSVSFGKLQWSATAE